jgi:hypothetical protein
VNLSGRYIILYKSEYQKNVLFVSWVSYPHFYKKGCLIVQYVGKNENIISDIEDILGEQFAGFKPQ